MSKKKPAAAPRPFAPEVPGPTPEGRIAAAPPAPGTKPPRARPRRSTDEGPPRELGPLITVRALKTGFVDNVRRREGDVFDVHEVEFSENWMVVVDGDTPRQTTGPAAALKRIHDETIAGRLGTPASDPLGVNSTTSRA